MFFKRVNFEINGYVHVLPFLPESDSSSDDDERVDVDGAKSVPAAELHRRATMNSSASSASKTLRSGLDLKNEVRTRRVMLLELVPIY